MGASLTVISNPATLVIDSPQSVGTVRPLEDVVVFRNGPMEYGVAVNEKLEAVEPTGLGLEVRTGISVAVTIVLTIVPVEVTVCSTKPDSVERAEVVTGRKEYP